MDRRYDRPDGWSRVLEHVSTTCPIAGTPNEDSAEVLEDRGQDEQDGRPRHASTTRSMTTRLTAKRATGRIVVDEGFIRMTSTVPTWTPKPGVRVRTRKVVGFRNSALIPWGAIGLLDGIRRSGHGHDARRRRNRADDPTGWTELEIRRLTPAKGPGQPKDEPPKRRRLRETHTSRAPSSWPSRWSTSASTTCPKERGRRRQVGRRDSADRRDDHLQR